MAQGALSNTKPTVRRELGIPLLMFFRSTIVMHPTPLLAAFLLTTIALPTAVAAQELPPAQPDLGQPAYPNCQPPSRGEYLLLLPSKTPDSQERIRRSLPKEATQAVCSYLNEPVTRVGGFTTSDSANAWAKYLKATLGATAVVVRPAEVAATPPPSSPSPGTSAATSSSGFNPQPLSGGYAVLVDFFSKPEVAAQVQQATNSSVGLVSYRQRPYLLAIYTPDQGTANSAAQSLLNRGLRTIVVDSRRVTLLRSAVVLGR